MTVPQGETWNKLEEIALSTAVDQFFCIVFFSHWTYDKTTTYLLAVSLHGERLCFEQHLFGLKLTAF